MEQMWAQDRPVTVREVHTALVAQRPLAYTTRVGGDGQAAPQGLAGPGTGRACPRVRRVGEPRTVHRRLDDLGAGGQLRPQRHPGRVPRPARSRRTTSRAGRAARPNDDLAGRRPQRTCAMTGAGALLTWAALLAIAAPRLLKRARWTTRSPRLGVVVWQATTASIVTAGRAQRARARRAYQPSVGGPCSRAREMRHGSPRGLSHASRRGAVGAGLVLAIAVSVRVGWPTGHPCVCGSAPPSARACSGPCRPPRRHPRRARCRPP
jgi:hypothetical protein